MKNKVTAVIDIDGVICNFESAFCDAFGNKNRHLYKLEERYPNLNPDLISEWANSEENYRDLAPIFGGMLLIQQLKDRGFHVILMTSRGEHLRKVTESWLTQCYIDVPVMFQTNKAGNIHDWNAGWTVPPVTVFVDDSVSQLEQVKKLNPSVTCLAWGQPWNAEYFPRLRYNETNFKIEANTGLGEWRHIWDYK